MPRHVDCGQEHSILEPCPPEDQRIAQVVPEHIHIPDKPHLKSKHTRKRNFRKRRSNT